MPGWPALCLSLAACALGSSRGSNRLVFDLHPKPRKRRRHQRHEPGVHAPPPNEAGPRRLQSVATPVDLFNLDNVQYVMQIEVGEPFPCQSAPAPLAAPPSAPPAASEAPTVLAALPAALPAAAPVPTPSAAPEQAPNFVLRPGNGCSTWREGYLPEAFDDGQPVNNIDCARRCASQVGCLAFGFQAGDGSECSVVAHRPGKCVLLYQMCQEESNPCWDLYDMSDPLPSPYGARALQEDQAGEAPQELRKPAMHGGQVLEVLPDTGSADLWIAAKNCSNCVANSTLFDIDRSCSAQQLGDRATFGYRDGTTASGGTFLDTVFFGNLKMTEQLVIQVDHMDADTHMKSDGILGLGPQSYRGKSFVTLLYEEHPSLPKMFSFFLKGKTEVVSKLVFGDPDFGYAKEVGFQYSKAYSGPTQSTWLATVRSVGWTSTSWTTEDYHVSSSTSGSQGMAALVDSGTSLIVLAADMYDSLMAELFWRLNECVHDEKQDIMKCDCPPANDLSRIPWFVITFVDYLDEDFSVCMSPEEFILESPDPDRPGGAQCIPAFSRGGTYEVDPIILGMTFMRSFYTNFDVEHMQVGFARSAESPLPAHSMCRPHRHGLWAASIVLAAAALLFACYVAFDSDKEGCQCGPGAEEEQPESNEEANGGPPLK